MMQKSFIKLLIGQGRISEMKKRYSQLFRDKFTKTFLGFTIYFLSKIGATTFSIMTLSITTLSITIVTISIMTLSITTLSITIVTSSIMTLSIMPFDTECCYAD